MPYRGEAMSGFAGHHRTLADLELVRPADDNVGRIATVGTPETTAVYHISQGNGWEPLVTAQTNALTGGISLSAGSNSILLNDVGVKTVLYGDSMTDWYNTIIQPTATYDQSTGVITFTESAHRLCNGTYTRFWSFAYASVRDQRRLSVAVIDANTYTVTLTDKPKDIATGAVTTPYVRHESRRAAGSWVNWLQARNNFCFNVVNNAAQSGDTSTGCLSRLSLDVLAYSPQLVLMQCPGINDQSASNGSLVEELTISNLTSIFNQILNSGSALIALTITPVASGEARGTVAIMERVQRINKFIYSFARGKNKMHVIDAWGSIVNPSDTTGLAVTGFLKTSDKIHYSNDGALRIAKLVEPTIQALIPARPSPLPKSYLESYKTAKLSAPTGAASGGIVTITQASHGYRLGEEFRVSGATPSQANGVFTVASVPTTGTFTYSSSGIADGALTGTLVIGRNRNVLGNVLFQTATGGTVNAPVTGVAASGLAISNIAGASGTYTCAASVSLEPSGYGNEQVMTITAAAVGDGVKIRASASTGANSYVADIISGRTYQMGCQLRLASSSWADTPIDQIDFSMLITMDGIERRVSAIENYDSITNPSVAEDMTLCLVTEPMLIPSGASITSATFELDVRFKGSITAAKTLIVGYSRAAILDVT